MECPNCKDDYPKGGKSCPNCGFEPMKMRRLIISFLIAAPLFIAIMTSILIMEEDDGGWLSIIIAGPALGSWMWLGIYYYRWLRWTRPVDSYKAVASDSG
jgi:hypothetical protein